jgi:hypothetical protein
MIMLRIFRVSERAGWRGRSVTQVVHCPISRDDVFTSQSEFIAELINKGK